LKKIKIKMDTRAKAAVSSKRCFKEFDLMHAHAPRTAYFQSLPRLAGLLDWSENLKTAFPGTLPPLDLLSTACNALQPVPREPDGF
jgi:hypothetical protein